MLQTIGIIIDVVLVLICLISAIIGMKKGFLQSVLSIFSWFVCLLVAIFTAKYVAGWINGIYDFSSLIGNKIATSLNNSNTFFATAVNTFANKEQIIDSIPNSTNGLFVQLIKVLFSNTAVDMTSTQTVGQLIGQVLGHISMVIIAGLLVFIVLKIVVALLSKLFDNINRTKVLGAVNKGLGLCLGLVRAVLIIAIVNFILVGLSLIPAVNQVITPVIKDNTYVEKVVYNTTDKIFGKYVIEGNTIQTWVQGLWNKR